MIDRRNTMRRALRHNAPANPNPATNAEDPYHVLGAALHAVVEHAVAIALASLPTPMAGEHVMLSVPQAAEQLGVGTTKLKQLIASGRITSVTIGRRRLIPMSAIRSLAASSEDDLAQTS
jgi:excisionase family DNA binding protein